MAIFVDQDTKLLVQGLTGGQGRFHGLRNREYGTQVVAGVTPGKEARRRGHPHLRHRRRRRHRHGCRRAVRGAAQGGAGGHHRGRDRGHRLRRCITEGIPAQDEAAVFNLLRRDHPGTRLLGPNCPGIISPGKRNIGITGGRDRSGALVRRAQRRHRVPLRHPHLPGPLRAEAEGDRRVDPVGIGGDPVPGTSFVDCLAEFEKDSETHAIMLIGEIGGRPRKRRRSSSPRRSPSR